MSLTDARNKYLDFVTNHPKTVAIVLAVIAVVSVIAMLR